MSKWSEWKKAQGETRPWHLLDPSKYEEDPIVGEERLNICKECPFFVALTTQCKKCGCIMSMKTKLKSAACPIGKW